MKTRMLMVLFIISLLLSLAILINTVYNSHVSCERFNLAQAQRLRIGHEPWARPLSCNLIFPQGLVK
jgi:hypothetical protein